ncbi:MAG: matrixin family metalloprotease [Candidatus Erginobacter occultus]|nr:matrixin family metalloprotease [Candidatus Erginobacter occultus]
MKKVFAISILISLALLAAGNLQAFTVSTGDDGSFLSWAPERTAVFYRIGSSGTPVHPRSVEETGRAFSEWEEKSRGEIAFIYEGPSEAGQAEQDGHNTLVWVSPVWPYGPEIAAVSTLWPAAAPGRIAEVDIEFNARDYDWTRPGSSDLLETTLHEIGHLLGIGHSFNPGAVMHDLRYPDLPTRQFLSRDDLEALAFLYPPRERKIFQYDLPVLFYPRFFPGEDPVFPPGDGFDPGPERWITALGSIDLFGDGYISGVITAGRDRTGGKFLSGWELSPPGPALVRELDLTRELSPDGRILALAGVDYRRDQASTEAAVLARDHGRESIFFFRFDGSGPGLEAVLPLASPSANNLVGMAVLDADGSGFRDNILLLRAYPGRYSLLLYRVPLPGETISAPDPGLEIPLPGLQNGSRILGLAVIDPEDLGRESDLVFLELSAAGDYWLHLFTLLGPPAAAAYDVRYQSSVPLPSPPSAVHPGRVTGLDLNRDGFHSQLIIHSPAK